MMFPLRYLICSKRRVLCMRDIENYNNVIKYLLAENAALKQKISDMSSKTSFDHMFSNASYKMFLDDERYPSTVNWVIVRSYEQAVEIIKEIGLPSFISFDHDLGEGKSGYDFALYLIDY